MHKDFKYLIDNELTMTRVGVDLKTNLLDYINRVPSLTNVLWKMNRSAKLAEYLFYDNVNKSSEDFLLTFTKLYKGRNEVNNCNLYYHTYG